MMLNDMKRDMMLYGADPKGYMDVLSVVYAKTYAMMQQDDIKNPDIGSRRDDMVTAFLEQVSKIFALLTGEGISVEDLRDNVDALQEMVTELEEIEEEYDHEAYQAYLDRVRDADEALQEEILELVRAFVKKTLPEFLPIYMDDLVK